MHKRIRRIHRWLGLIFTVSITPYVAKGHG